MPGAALGAENAAVNKLLAHPGQSKELTVRLSISPSVLRSCPVSLTGDYMLHVLPYFPRLLPSSLLSFSFAYSFLLPPLPSIYLYLNSLLFKAGLNGIGHFIITLLPGEAVCRDRQGEIFMILPWETSRLNISKTKRRQAEAVSVPSNGVTLGRLSALPPFPSSQFQGRQLGCGCIFRIDEIIYVKWPVLWRVKGASGNSPGYTERLVLLGLLLLLTSPFPPNCLVL